MNTLLIAEAGINHQGSFQKAKQYIIAAAESGADFVKFHMASADRMINLDEKRILWNESHPINIEPIDEFVSKMELSLENYSELISLANRVKIGFMVSCYDLISIKEAINLGVNAIKLASCDFIKEKSIRYLNDHVDYICLATGMVDESELQSARDYIDPIKTHILHCISLYPSPLSSINLNFMNKLKSFGWNVGYSDHTKGIGVSVASLFNKPVAIEKHFMLEDDLNCPDQIVSCTPRELKELSQIIRSYEKLFGSYDRILTDEEINNRKKFRNRWSS